MTPVSITDLPAFDEVIDVRSPGEFAEDHIPGAINLPVLDNAERERVGTLYKQVSSFEAKKVGAAMVSRNIARHLEAHFASKPKSYRPAVYCWRGGTRSGSLTHILQKIGFTAAQLDGGYKAYRRHVVGELASRPAQFTYRIVCGTTGSGKSRLLQELEQAGAQVLDLEALAAHRGSLLGALPDQPQPSQKMFESAIWQALTRFDPQRTVFVESESKKIGALRVPEALILAMRASPCIRLEVPLAARVRLLTEDYAHFLHDPAIIHSQLAHLVQLRGNETIAAWQDMVSRQEWDQLVAALLEEHYDPAYLRSLMKNYAPSSTDVAFSTDDLSRAGLKKLAHDILTTESQR
ncbi:MAG: tRNA 2-selenouridine(34) synthase MnmH [Thiobacillus sp.]|nr:tRNA 2-selenouridine(34) synthase MnmH [Thiobacillus sp.]